MHQSGGMENFGCLNAEVQFNHINRKLSDMLLFPRVISYGVLGL